MIPYILATIGGYLIGEATRKKFNPLDNPYNILEKGGETKFAKGGNVEYDVEVSLMTNDGNRYRFVFDIEADNEKEAKERAEDLAREYADVDFKKILETNIVHEYEMMADGGVLLENPKFTFKTDRDYQRASMGYIDKYDLVRVEMETDLGYTIDFPIHSEEEYLELKNNENKAKKIKKVYQDQSYHDPADYYDPEDDREEDEDYEDYAKGGKIKKSKIKDKRVKFVDKVESIAMRLKGTKVPKRLRKDYGATYDSKEAKEAGRRIAGSQLKKLKNEKG